MVILVLVLVVLKLLVLLLGSRSGRSGRSCGGSAAARNERGSCRCERRGAAGSTSSRCRSRRHDHGGGGWHHRKAVLCCTGGRTSASGGISCRLGWGRRHPGTGKGGGRMGMRNDRSGCRVEKCPAMWVMLKGMRMVEWQLPR
jgi:hypothetical protein